MEPRNFVDIGPFLTKPVSVERSTIGLSIDTGFDKNGPISTKLWDPQVGYPKSFSKRLDFMSSPRVLGRDIVGPPHYKQ